MNFVRCVQKIKPYALTSLVANGIGDTSGDSNSSSACTFIIIIIIISYARTKILICFLATDFARARPTAKLTSSVCVCVFECVLLEASSLLTRLRWTKQARAHLTLAHTHEQQQQLVARRHHSLRTLEQPDICCACVCFLLLINSRLPSRRNMATK